MAKYQVEAPNGQKFIVEGEGSADEALAHFKENYKPPTAANAGVMAFGANLLGTPGTVLKGLVNIPGMVVGTAASAAGRPDLAPDVIDVPGTGQDFMKMLTKAANATGIEGLNPNPPNPEDQLNTDAYKMASMGGFIPGNALPAIGALAAEKILGPEWSGVGALLPAAGSRLANAALDTKVAPQVRKLADEGVQMTTGQIMGGPVKRVEDAATSIPILGDAIKGAQTRSIESFNKAAINRALAPIGETLPSGMKGAKAVEFVYDKLGDAYDALLPNLKGRLDYRPAPNGTPSLRDDLNSLRFTANGLPEPQKGQLNRIIQKEIIGKFTPQGNASGETLKGIESNLGMLSKAFKKSDNYDTRLLSNAVEEMQASVRRMVEAVNPEYSGQLAKINEGYANFKRVQSAAASAGAQEGVFSPAQLHRAVRAGDISKDKGRFAEGRALMQDLSSAGKTVLPPTVPDSGTAIRGALMYAAAHPLRSAALAVPVSLAALPYTSPVQGALQSVLLNRTPAPAIPPGILQALIASQQAQQ